MIKLVSKLIPERKLLTLLMMGLNGQTISGYGFSTTFNFPKEKREEILKELGL